MTHNHRYRMDQNHQKKISYIIWWQWVWKLGMGNYLAKLQQKTQLQKLQWRNWECDSRSSFRIQLLAQESTAPSRARECTEASGKFQSKQLQKSSDPNILKHWGMCKGKSNIEIIGAKSRISHWILLGALILELAGGRFIERCLEDKSLMGMLSPFGISVLDR